MKLLITGGTGFVGSRLLEELKSRGHSAVVLTRNPEKAKAKDNTGAEFHRWDGISEEVPKEVFEGIEGVINLMGENIANKRWSDEQKRKLEKSRIDATEKLVSGVENHLQGKLKVFVSASASGYYPVNTGEKLDEATAPGDGFLAKLCQKWESATEGLTKCERKIIMRTGVVLGPEDGALSKLLPIFKLGLGGPIGSGSMMMSWIHVDDLVKAICEFVENNKYSGIYNMTAPNPVSNKEFTKAFAKAVHRPAFFPVPPFMLKLLMGEMSTIVLDSQNVVPQNLEKDGFKFDHPRIEEALEDLLN